MAKKKEEVVSIDDEFGNEPIGDDTDQSEKDKATEKAVTTETVEAPEVSEKDDASEQVSDQVTAPAEKTWKDFGVDDFEGKSNEEIAEIVKIGREDIAFRRRILAEQADELGELRKFRTESEAKVKPAEEEKPDILDSMPEMTEGEILDFNKIYESHPVKAILKYGRPVIEQLVNQRVQDAIKGGVKSTITESIDGQRDSLDYANFLSRHEDAETYEPPMKMLDRPEHLGEQHRPYEELFGLAKLGVDKDPLYTPVYQLMSKYSNMTFKEAQQFAKQQMGSKEAAQVKRQKIQQDIDKIDAVNSSTTASAKSKTTGEIVTIDDEFQI